MVRKRTEILGRLLRILATDPAKPTATVRIVRKGREEVRSSSPRIPERIIAGLYSTRPRFLFRDRSKSRSPIRFFQRLASVRPKTYRLWQKSDASLSEYPARTGLPPGGFEQNGGVRADAGYRHMDRRPIGTAPGMGDRHRQFL